MFVKQGAEKAHIKVVKPMGKVAKPDEEEEKEEKPRKGGRR